MNIFTYIQHLYTAIVLCKCVLTYIFSNYYNIHKEGKKKKSKQEQQSTFASSPAAPQPVPTGVRGTWWPTAIRCPTHILLLVKMTGLLCIDSLHACRFTFPIIYSSDPYIQAETTGSWRHGPLLSVARFPALPCVGTGRRAPSCLSVAI